MKKMKDLYGYQPDMSTNDNLVLWFNHMLEKRVSDFTIPDVCRSLRQNIFIEQAVQAGISYMMSDPFAGELWKGEIANKFADIPSEYITRYKEPLIRIIKAANNIIQSEQWEDEEEKNDILEIFERLNKKVTVSAVTK